MTIKQIIMRKDKLQKLRKKLLAQHETTFLLQERISKALIDMERAVASLQADCPHPSRFLKHSIVAAGLPREDCTLCGRTAYL